MKYHSYFPFIVEDDDNFALLLRRAFRKAGVPSENIHWFSDGESARRAFESLWPLRPSLVTLDMELPGMSGISLLRWIRTSGCLDGLPVYVLSGREDRDLISSAYALQARGYWCKPTDLSALQKIISGILNAADGDGRDFLPGCLPDPGLR